MSYHVLTSFLQMVLDGLNTNIIGRAVEKQLISVETVDIRDFSKDKHKRMDDAPYGGGVGMVTQPEPIYGAYEDLCIRLGRRPKVFYMTPQGRVLDQKTASELAMEEDLVFLCGHYEGIDERALEMIVADYLSMSDYMLTDGELPTMMMIDCIPRLVPGVLNNDGSAEIESFYDSLLECPQYARPEVYEDRTVPGVLLSDHHKNIHEWRRRESIRRTPERRPNLLDGVNLTKKEWQFLEELIQAVKEDDEEPSEQLQHDLENGLGKLEEP